MTLSEFVIQSYTNAKEKGFWKQDRNVGEMLMLIVSELGEAIEAHRAGKCNYPFNEPPKFDENTSKDSFEMEIADAFIRLADLCGGLGIPIWQFIEWKMNYNKKRPQKHGKQY